MEPHHEANAPPRIDFYPNRLFVYAARARSTTRYWFISNSNLKDFVMDCREILADWTITILVASILVMTCSG